MKTPATILIVDDEPSIRRSFSAFLEDCDYRVLDAENGKAGLEVFRRERPDLLLIDLRMPEVDGLEVTETVARESPETPVVVVSGTGVLQDAIEAIHKGAWDFILKPVVDMEVLIHTVRKALERSRLTQENEDYRRSLEEKVRQRTSDLEVTNQKLLDEVKERERAQEELRKLNEKLERKVSERTADLEEANLELENSLVALRDDEEAGRKIQFSLLPPARKRFRDFEFDRYLVPSLYVSGDFVDYFEIDEDHVGFYIADAAGHGVSSAFLTVFLKTLMTNCVDRHQKDGDPTILHPTRLLMRLNEEFCRERMERHATLFYGVIGLQDSQLVYSGAGQFPHPVFFHAGHTETIETAGLPIGLFPIPEYSESTLVLPKEFALAFFSDGILEILPEADLQKKEAFISSLIDSADVDVPTLISKLNLKDRESPPDDVTILLLRRRSRV